MNSEHVRVVGVNTENECLVAEIEKRLVIRRTIDIKELHISRQVGLGRPKCRQQIEQGRRAYRIIEGLYR